MEIKVLGLTIITLLASSCTSCQKDRDPKEDQSTNEYSGTASVTQGLATTTMANLYPSGQRVAGLGSITAIDNSTWVVPAEVNYSDDSFPFAPDLYNPDGVMYATSSDALSAFDPSDIVEIDASGDVMTGFIFADNYFELYINGIPVGKDAIPFTPFNSHIVKFKVSKPFTIAMLLVDWEESLGLGTENNQGSDFHAGDGGLVAVIKDEDENVVAVTDGNWKAQTYYTAPVKDLGCVSENGAERNSGNCDTGGSNDGSNFYGLHWAIPADWNLQNFDDSSWPNATTYTNTQIGVDNKPSYTNFTDIFDDSNTDAAFIWSTNVILDNEVLVRYTVDN